MINPESIKIGKLYQNIKTGDVYEVVLISRDSEAPSQLWVSYDKEGDAIPWNRRLDLFVRKFEEVEDASVSA